MCQALEVSRSGYYAWEERKPSKRKQDDVKFKGILFKAFHESNRTYGCGRLGSVLEDMGFHVGRRRISRLQREATLFPVQRKKFYHTTDSNHSLPICRNLVKQDFSSNRPNALWTSDVKMVRTDEGWLYLCIILDVFSRRASPLIKQDSISLIKIGPFACRSNESLKQKRMTKTVPGLLTFKLFRIQKFSGWRRRYSLVSGLCILSC
jgi:hypothetical protein